MTISGMPETQALQHIQSALAEDVGRGWSDFPGDHSSLACFQPHNVGVAVLKSKEKGVLAGLDIALAVLRTVDEQITTDVFLQDGSSLVAGQEILRAYGPLTSLLTAERTLLNYIQRLSGIATTARKWSQHLEGTQTTLLDTRKTTPGWRLFEKYAVRIGGVQNHRMGLFDMIMLKDNHIDYSGGITPAVRKAQAYLDRHSVHLPIEIEARTFQDVQEAVELPSVQRIMLDNFSPEECVRAVQWIAGRKETEASGGITEETFLSYARTGVTYISMGALTHSVKNLDLHFKAVSL